MCQNEKKKALDLFSGTKSVGEKLKKMGYQVTSVDIVKRTKPDIAVDIMQWEYWKDFQPGYFDLVAASVPCNEYSQAKKGVFEIWTRPTKWFTKP